ncbi:MAG: hypothetical protein RRY02_08065 [Muribaculaceae bacterium]
MSWWSGTSSTFWLRVEFSHTEFTEFMLVWVEEFFPQIFAWAWVERERRRRSTSEL